MENYVNEKVNDKKVDDYSFEKKNFVVPSELTVTITLGEYRELVSKVAQAQHDIDKANTNRWEKEHRIEELEKLVTVLKDKLLKYVADSETIQADGEVYVTDNPAERGEF